MTTVPPPPTIPLATPKFEIIGSGSTLHRNHAEGFRAVQFNPCIGQPSRFASFQDTRGACVASLYAATSREAAAFESVFHDIEASARFKTVALSAVESRRASVIRPRRDLHLVCLFAPDLKAWGLERNQLIDTPKSTYGQTVLWAAKIHTEFKKADGMIWTSRQCDPERCALLFGDRVAESDLEV